VLIFSRNELDWTAMYRDFLEAAKQRPVTSAIVDGEIVELNEAGLSDFAVLRKAINLWQHDLYFVTFELLQLDGYDLRDMAREDRREILPNLIKPGSHIQIGEPMPGDAKVIYHLVDQFGFEGMVLKRRESILQRRLDKLAKDQKAMRLRNATCLASAQGKPAFA
jgi:bifunctional non-homologous end joining protein LigD